MKIPTVCPYCGVGCLLSLQVLDGKVKKVTPLNIGPGEGKLCIKGWSAHEFIHHPDRLTKPLIRKNGGFIETGWRKALTLISRSLLEAKEEYGGNSVALLSSSKSTNEENYLLQKFARTVIGTNNIDNCARLCHASTIEGLMKSFGSGAMTNSQEDIEDADVIFVIGSNTSEQHPLIARRIIKAVKKGSSLILADPRSIDLKAYATIHLNLYPGTDVALINAFMNVIIFEGLQDTHFIKSRTEGFHELEKLVAKYTPEYAARITGVDAKLISNAAKIYAKADKASIIFSMGITQHTTGVNNVVSLANLAMLCGNIGRPGTGVNPLRGQNNVQGSCDMGALPDFLPGYRRVSDVEARKTFEERWGVKCPDGRGLTLIEMINECGGKIKAMYIMGENPLMTDPDLNHVKKQLEKLDFLAVSELFPSETTEVADVILPAASFAEKDGTYTATDRRIQRIRKAVEPVGESQPDWMIISQLSKIMGYLMPYTSPANVMEEIAELVPIYGGVSYERLDKGALKWPCIDENHPGTSILHVERFTRGRGRFVTVDYNPPSEVPDEEYPFILTTGRLLFHWHGGTMTRRSKTLIDQVNEAYIEINPSDANLLRIFDGEKVKVKSKRGEITLKASITERVKEGVVFIPFHFAEAAANHLTNSALDPEAKIPEFKVCAVKIEKPSDFESFPKT
ncbi:formate dehydrogenase subunit alpha [Candidatus Bathyarchaeota archaeon]|nr:formate dehydrogenase subunit alpha [Candidatus Bathyarchaeota archaeon]MBS7630892.1 formate dehydrogenase subunit alpha [Candidatus Bathyarchaeota archaeon]